MSILRKTLLSLLVVGAAGGAASFGVFSAFSATTTNPGNSFAAGSVSLSDNDADTALYNVSGRKPGDTVTRCVRVTYSGTLPATVKLYRGALSGSLGSYLDLGIAKGTGSQADCGDFQAGTSVHGSTLAAVPSTWDTGLALTDQTGSAVWDQNDAVTYRFTITLRDDNDANGKSTGAHAFTWEAVNN